MKKLLSFMFIFLTMIVLTGCSEQKAYDIVTTMFPQYDFARAIAKDKLSVGLIIPPGTEVHGFEATSQDLVMIKESKLFIFTSMDIDLWIKDPSTIGGKDTIVMDLSQHYEATVHNHEHETGLSGVLVSLDDDHHDHDHDDDIHFWTDPTTAIQLIEAILEKIILIDPDNQAFYEDNAHDYIHELEALHDEIDLFFQEESHHDQTFFFAGHNALGAFANRYHFEIISLFPDFKPDADLTSGELTSFIEQIKANQVTYLFIEELIEPKAALTIQSALANENYTIIIRELHGYHNVTKTELEDGITYLDLLERNFLYLQEAIDAHQ